MRSGRENLQKLGMGGGAYGLELVAWSVLNGLVAQGVAFGQ
jgi:hypothetical protein